MTAMIIIGAIIAVFALLLAADIRVEIKYIGAKLDFRVKYLFIQIFPMKPKKVKKINTKKVAEDVESTAVNTADEAAEVGADEVKAEESSNKTLQSQEKSEEKTEKRKLTDKLDELSETIRKIKLIWQYSEKSLKKIFNGIHFSNFYVDFVIAGSDAYKTAVDYGYISALTYNAIGLLRSLFRINFKTVDVTCDFNGTESVYDCSAAARLSLWTGLTAALTVLWHILIHKNEIFSDGKSSELAEGSDKIIQNA